jgi:hypothetical protein
MKTPISSYQKIYDQFLIGEFPEIDHLVVKKPSFPFSIFSHVKCDVYLKPADQIKSMVSCQKLLRQLHVRMKELNRYLGDVRNVEINIYFEGELLCHDVSRTSDLGPM